MTVPGSPAPPARRHNPGQPTAQDDHGELIPPLSSHNPVTPVNEVLSLIQGVLTLTQDGLDIPAPAVVDWAEAIDAHIAQSEGRSRGKTVVRLRHVHRPR